MELSRYRKITRTTGAGAIRLTRTAKRSYHHGLSNDERREKLRATPVPNLESPSFQNEDYIFIKSDGKIFKIQYHDLLFGEASGNYTKIVTTEQTFMPGMTFSVFRRSVALNYFAAYSPVVTH